MRTINEACENAVAIADDNSHGYDQINRWGPDFDCSSLVISAYDMRSAGATYTGNMRAAFTKNGFRALVYFKGIDLKRGDILLNEKHHTALYLGEGKIVQASINEKGTTSGGKTGDQTYGEIAVRKFYEYKYGWEYVLRPEEPKKEDVIKVNIEMTQLQTGSQGAEVSLLQTLLKTLGFVGKNGNPLTIDGVFGQNVEFAVKTYQKTFCTPDGIVGSKTWNQLLHSRY